jgi:hypothetical protein
MKTSSLKRKDQTFFWLRVRLNFDNISLKQDEL